MDKYCKMLNKLWLNAIIIIVLPSLTAIIYVWQFSNGYSIYGSLKTYWSFAAMAIMILCLFIGNNLTAKRIRRLKDKQLSQKLTGYKAEYSKRLKWFSAISFVAAVSLIFSSNMMYVIFALLSLLLVITARVMSVKVKYELNISEEDIKQMNKLKF